MLALALPVLGDGQKLGPNVSLVTRNSNPNNIIASFQVDMIEEANGSCQQCTELKSFEIRTYVDPDAMVKQIDILDLWNSLALYKECIALQASQGDAHPAQTYSELGATFDFGLDFVSSAKKLGFLHDSKKIPRLLRVCADILLGRNLADAHPLRSGMGGNDPQRVRGKWSAWRHDIDYEFHLHYWKNGANIEFANVVTHEDVSITK